MGTAAFAGTGVEEVELPDSLAEVGACAFCSCPRLREVRLGTGIATIGDDAFADCGALETVKVPASFQVSLSEALDPGVRVETIP